MSPTRGTFCARDLSGRLELVDRYLYTWCAGFSTRPTSGHFPNFSQGLLKLCPSSHVYYLAF